MNETVPSNVIDNGYSCSTNLSQNTGVLISMLLSQGMPSDIQSLQKTKFWQVIYGIPILICLATLFLNTCVHKHDSLTFHVIKKEEQKALEMIHLVYP